MNKQHWYEDRILGRALFEKRGVLFSDLPDDQREFDQRQLVSSRVVRNPRLRVIFLGNEKACAREMTDVAVPCQDNGVWLRKRYDGQGDLGRWFESVPTIADKHTEVFLEVKQHGAVVGAPDGCETFALWSNMKMSVVTGAAA